MSDSSDYERLQRQHEESLRKRQRIVQSYPYFWALLGGTFNQDWMCDYENSWTAAVDDWIGNPAQNPIGWSRSCGEIEDLLQRYSEEELRGIFELLRTDIVPADDGLTHREWLQEVLRRLRAAG